MMSPFEFLNSINDTKKDIMIDDLDEKDYISFMINRSLSYFPDTVCIANEMNRYHHLDKKLQYHFLMNIIRKRKRFSKWIKPDTDTTIDLIKEFYHYSDEKARQVLPLLTNDQIEILKQKVYKGGKVGRPKTSQ